MYGDRRGFTLLEVAVAIVIGSIVLLGARAILEQLGDTADRVTARAIEADRMANTERVAQGVLRRTIAGEKTPFVGFATNARFTSWCDVPTGWRERCAVAIDLHPTASPTDIAVTLQTSAGDTIHLYEHARRATLRYLEDAADGGRWTSYWAPEAGVPLAIGISTDKESLVLRIGARR